MGFISPEFAAFSKRVSYAMEIPDEYISVFSEKTWAIFGPGALAFEEALTTLFPGFMSTMNSFHDTHFVRTRKVLPLNERPVDVLFAVFLYFVSLFVLYLFAKVVGKHSYRFLGLIHNFFLFAISLYMCVGFFFAAVGSDFQTLWNNPVADTKTDDMGWCLAKLGWVFLISKVPEFGDTFLMVLKHNWHQISFLHLYHHSSILIWTYCIMSGAPGGDVYWPSMVNSGVHVIMYGYYAGTLAAGKEGHFRRFLNGIKFYITKIQIIQFVFNMAQSVNGLIVTPAHYPRYLCVGQTLYMVSMLVLFGNFLLRNQGKKTVKGGKAPAGKAVDAKKESKKQK